MFPYPNGPFGNMMPYSDFHGMNLDWVIRIAKDFLDQYTHIQEIITQGETDITETAAEKLEELNNEYERLNGLLDQWYTTHSEDIANELLTAIQNFSIAATARAQEAIESIPGDYTDLYNQVMALVDAFPVTENYTLSEYQPLLTKIDGEAVQSSTGNIINNANYARIAAIPTRGATSFRITSVEPIINWCTYDQNGNYITGSSTETTDTGSIDISPIVGTIIFSFHSADTITDIHLTLANYNTPLGLLRSTYRNFYNDSIKGTQFPNNLVDPTDWIDNAFVNTSNGTLVRNETNYFVTGPIPVTPEVVYKANHGRNLAWYDENMQYVAGTPGTSVQTGVTAPEDAAFVRISINKTTDGISTPFLLYFTTSALYNGSTIIPGLEAQTIWCYGKRINWIGDSIVAGEDFDEEVCSALGLIKDYEYGINGSTIALSAAGTDARNAICIRYADMTNNADIIAVSAGTNDFMYAWCPIGSINDPDDGSSNSTFYGALKTLCKGLITKYPDKCIFFTTPIKRAQAFADGNGGTYTPDNIATTPYSKNKYGKTLMDYADIIKEVCGYYSIPVLDLNRESMLNPHIASQEYLFDESLTHPTAQGRKIMARRVAGWLTQLGYNIT